MENSREGRKNRGIDGSRGDQGSRVLFERFRPPHDTVKTVSCGDRVAARFQKETPRVCAALDG